MGVAGRALAQATKKPPFRKRGVGGIYTYTSNYTSPGTPTTGCYGERRWRTDGLLEMRRGVTQRVGESLHPPPKDLGAGIQPAPILA